MENFYNNSIILIGPSGAGKSATAEELKKITKMPRLCLDGIANNDRINGIKRKFNTIDEYNLYLLTKVLHIGQSNRVPGIVDFGAGHSVYDDPTIFAQVQKILNPFKNIILLLPSVDSNVSLKIMADRSTGDTRENAKFIQSPCNRELATMTIYGNERTPEQIAQEIIEKINARNNSHRTDMQNQK